MVGFDSFTILIATDDPFLAEVTSLWLFSILVTLPGAESIDKNFEEKQNFNTFRHQRRVKAHIVEC